MKTIVEKDKCISCALCPSLSALYTMGGDGKAVAVKEDISAKESVEAHEAAKSCPTNAIIVVE